MDFWQTLASQVAGGTYVTPAEIERARDAVANMRLRDFAPLLLRREREKLILSVITDVSLFHVTDPFEQDREEQEAELM
jgi:hypothetical protein